MIISFVNLCKKAFRQVYIPVRKLFIYSLSAASSCGSTYESISCHNSLSPCLVCDEKGIRKSSQLKQVFLLIDIRHDPSDNDRMMYDWIENNGYRPVIVATKLDKIKRSQISKQVKAVRTGLGLRQEDILIPFSSQTKQGLKELWRENSQEVYDYIVRKLM